MNDTNSNLHTIAGAMHRRLLIDSLFKYVMTFGGISVIAVISLIFFYLAGVAYPLFKPVAISDWQSYAVPGSTSERTLYLASEEQREMGARFTDQGVVRFFKLRDGASAGEARIKLPAGASITSFAAGDAHEYVAAYGLSDGRVVVVKQQYGTSFNAENKRVISPEIIYPLGEEPLVLDARHAAIDKLAVQSTDDGTTLVALTRDGRLLLAGLSATKNLVTGEMSVERSSSMLEAVEGVVQHIVIDVKQRELYVAHGDRLITHFDITDKAAPRRVQMQQVVAEGESLSALTILSGGFSLIVGTDKGSLSQWFLVRDAKNNHTLTRIRDFTPMPGKVATLAPEYFRKGFVAGDDGGNVGLYYATSQKLLWLEPVGKGGIVALETTPRGNGLVVQSTDGKFYAAHVDNEFPEISFSSLWQKVWYESYEKPEYIWQSAAATNDFEPKFSLTPLTLGTLKASFYAMIIAVPLALLSAIFGAYFMAPRMRQTAKPAIEIMAALPTVILGFLAGLWLAPLVENNLAGVMLTFVLLPIIILITSYIWHLLPESLSSRMKPGWEAALLMPVVMFVMWLAFQIGHPVEAMYFGGDLPHWLTSELGVSYEQRNSLVVGIAMGFAVIPTIFSIAEDAIFSVPKHFTMGSLALGATRWQTLKNVILPTASPGIFSAVMIGLGRAVGETMIVLMATGNTAVMDLSIFTGFRTLAANIGVEMPEAAVGTTHFRLLFVSALVLFAFTFVVNTLAELIRQRLREKYSER
ncbi:MAG: ABC transporter permease subunit [Rhodocyclales bacterium]|nr:ABC transporter permease subunit [Rhodocyclales bacterium]